MWSLVMKIATASFPDVFLAAKGVGAQRRKGRGKDASSSPVSRASSSPASPASESKRLRRRQKIATFRPHTAGLHQAMTSTAVVSRHL